MSQDDDDEATNRRAGFWRGRQGRAERERDTSSERREEVSTPASRWNVDGSEIGHSDVELRLVDCLISLPPSSL